MKIAFRVHLRIDFDLTLPSFCENQNVFTFFRQYVRTLKENYNNLITT